MHLEDAFILDIYVQCKEKQTKKKFRPFNTRAKSHLSIFRRLTLKCMQTFPPAQNLFFQPKHNAYRHFCVYLQHISNIKPYAI